MRVIPLKTATGSYSCVSYMILGEWNLLGDVNTLIDPGTDADAILAAIEATDTGVGKVAVVQVLLTHNHFDHAAAATAVKRAYRSKVMAFTLGEQVERRLADQEMIMVGDSFCEVLHTPGHSSDSLCFYFPKEQVLFSGDTPLSMNRMPGDCSPELRETLARLARLKVETIYPGHGPPFLKGGGELIRKALAACDATETEQVTHYE